MILPNIRKTKKCSKPPTSCVCLSCNDQDFTVNNERSLVVPFCPTRGISSRSSKGFCWVKMLAPRRTNEPKISQNVLKKSCKPSISRLILEPRNHLPSGNLLQFAIEHGPVEIVDFPSYIAWWIFPVRFLLTFTRPGIRKP